MKYIQWFSLMGMMFFMFLLASCKQEEEPILDFYYEQSEYGNYYILKNVNTNLDVVHIPDRVNDMPVRVISYEAFINTEVVEIHIPDTIQTIRSNAFNSKTIARIVFGEASELISLDLSAYRGSSVKELYIPKDAYVYWGAEEVMIEHVSVHPDHVEYQVIDDVVYSKDGETLYYVPNQYQEDTLIVRDGIKNIGMRSFYMQQTLSSVTLPDSVENIEMGAFQYSQIDEITLTEGSSLKQIGNYAFHYSNIKNLYLPDTLLSLGEFAFGHSSISELIIPSSLKVIEENAFYFSHIESIQFAENSQLETIESQAFVYTHKLKSIEFPESLINVGGNLFANSVVESITFHGDTFNVSSSVFSGALQLKEIHVTSSFSQYSSENGILYNQGMTELIFYPQKNPQTTYQLPMTLQSIQIFAIREASIEHYSALFNPYFQTIDGVLYSKDSKTLISYPKMRVNPTYQIPYGVQSINSNAFYETEHLKTLIVASSVKEIKPYAITNCEIDYIHFMPNSQLHTLGSSFLFFTKVKHLIIPKSVKVLESRAFNSAIIELLEFEEDFDVILTDDLMDLSHFRINGIILPVVPNTFSIQYLTRFRYVYFPSEASNVPELQNSTNYFTFFYFEDDLGETYQYLKDRVTDIYFSYDINDFRNMVLGTSYSD